MAITFTSNPAADATFADLFTDDSGSTWYQLWTGNGNTGNFVDTSAFNDEGKGWISADDLADLDIDFAQAGDTTLWVRVWDAENGTGEWEGGAVDLDAAAADDITETVSGNAPLSQMFNVEDTTENTWFQIWNGDEAGTQGAYLDTDEGRGWVTADELGDYFYQASSFVGDESFFDTFGVAGGNELWVRTWVGTDEDGGVDYGWEHWTVDNAVQGTISGVALSDNVMSLSVDTQGGATTLIGSDVVIDGDPEVLDENGEVIPSDGIADVLRLTGDADIRIDLTDPTDQVEGLDLNGDGVIAFDGEENNLSDAGILTVSNFEVFDAYARNPLDYTDTENNFFGDIEFDGTGFDGDGVNTDGNIFLGGLGSDEAYGGIGNDFMAGGGSVTGGDALMGGRNADFFFVEISALDATDGENLNIDGGTTWDSAASQDSDWILVEASDDNEPVYIDLAGETITTDTTIDNVLVDIDNIENVDASGNLYAFLNDYDVVLGGAADDKDAHAADGTENYGIGSTAQLVIDGTAAANILVGGYDNDEINGAAGDDVILGGNMQYLEAYQNNPNILSIDNDGRDELSGDAGDDSILFEMDGGIYDGGADVDTLWISDYVTGASSNDLEVMTTDGVIRIDLGVGQAGGVDNYAGYGGADEDATYADGVDYITADQTNYADGVDRAVVQNFENINATGLGAIDYDTDGTNSSDLNFTGQMNFYGSGADLDLRGTAAANILYANIGDDVLEGREGDDSLMGGEGDDDFIFYLDAGDGKDVIHRLVDADGDNIVDVDEDGEILYEADFGQVTTVLISDSSLTLTFINNDDPASELADFPVSGVVFTLDGVQYSVESDEMGAAETYADFVAAMNTVMAATEGLEALTATLNADDSITIVDPDGAEFAPVGYQWVNNIVPADGNLVWTMVEGSPDVEQSQDRLIFASYEDRADNELVDDDGLVNNTGDAVTLGDDAYAEDLVVSFITDEETGLVTTVISEDQSYDIEFLNLADEDSVTVSVNGVAFSAQMGVAADGTAIDETMNAFLVRFADTISSASDNDTKAGQINAVAVGDTITLTQVAYNGGETVFMDTPVVTLTNGSHGEAPSAEVTDNSDTEITLYEFDGTDNALNATNVIFAGDAWMQDQVDENSRSILETAATDGGELNGSDALIYDSMLDDDTDADDFSLHGDDYLMGGAGDDVITAGTGDDRIQGSMGDDVVDGGKDDYVVTTLVAGQQIVTVEQLNEYEAAVRLAEANVLSVEFIDEDTAESPAVVADGYADTLIFNQNDFVEGTTFTITVDADLEQQEGGQGVVGVDEDGDDIFEYTTDFVEMEAIRTLSGDGTHDGQGMDTLNVQALSDAVAATVINDPDAAVIYNMTSDLGYIQINADLDGDDEINDADDLDAADRNDFFLAVDGVEGFIGGDANETLNIDESEVLKDNYFDGNDEVTLVDDDDDETTDDPDLVGDSIVYDHTDMNNDGVADDTGTIAALDDEVSVSMRPSLEIVVESGAETDLINMTGGTIVGSDITTDTLIDVETINVTDGAKSAYLDDTLNVSNISGATVNFTDGEVLDAAGDVLVQIEGMTQIEATLGGSGADTIIVADLMPNYRYLDSDDDETAITYASYLSYDVFDDTNDDGEDDVRVSFSDQDVNDRAEANNQDLFSFDGGAGQDRVDYSADTSNIVAVVNLDAGEVAQSIFVTGADAVLTAANDRIDQLLNIEEVVASQGTSILDFTGSDTNLSISYMSANDATIVEGDVIEYTISIEDLDTSVPFGDFSYIEYMDAGLDDEVDATQALWETIEGSDYDEKVELTDDQSLDDHTFNLRGGDNEVNYNELTKGIELDIQDVADGITTATVFSLNTNGTLTGSFDTITSYNENNTIVEGSLRVEASQSEFDSVSFVGVDSNNLILLGEKQGNSDVVEVSMGVAAGNVGLTLTGFENLLDGAGDDVYEVVDLSDFFDTLSLVDTLGDEDTLKLQDDALEGVIVDGVNIDWNDDSIELDSIEVALGGFDFAALDISDLTESLDSVSTADAGETLILGDLDNFGDLDDGVDDVQGFGTIAFTTTEGMGTDVVIDMDLGEFRMDDADDTVLFEFDAATEFDFSEISDAMTITVINNTTTRAKLVVSDTVEEITGEGTGSIVELADDTDLSAIDFDNVALFVVNADVSMSQEDAAGMTFYVAEDGVLTLTVADGDDIELTADSTEADFIAAGVLYAADETDLNTAPVVVADADVFEVASGESVNIAAATLLANDTDADGDTLTITSVDNDGTADGTVELSDDGLTITFTAADGYLGDASFTYTVSDGSDEVSASVTGTVVEANEAPVAVNDTAAFEAIAGQDVVINAADLLANDTDADGDTLVITAVGQLSTADGTAVLSDDGLTITFTPADGYVGNANFTYTVSDGTATATAAVTGTVVAANEAPVAVDDAAAFEATAGQDVVIDVADLLANDTDADGDTLTITAVDQLDTADGTAVLSDDGLTITFTPADGYVGDADFTYTVSDGTDTATGTVTGTVVAANVAPVAADDLLAFDVTSGQSVVIDVADLLANDTDADGDTLSITAVAQLNPADGTAVLSDDGQTITFTAADGFVGSANFSYTVSDGAATAVGRVTGTVATGYNVINMEAGGTYVGVDGTAEQFVYEIDSSSGSVISGETADLELSGFNVAEDVLVFEDVDGGTITTDGFTNEVVISESTIFNQTDIIFDQDPGTGEGYQLTLVGIVDPDLSTIDFSVA